MDLGCSHGKPVLTVLDLIGQHRREFRFDVRYQALTGASRKELVHQVEQGFPFLPSGSQLILDRVAQTIVLDNVRRQLQLSRKDLVADLRSYGDLDLGTYLEEAGRDLSDIYKSRGSWTARSDAKLAFRLRPVARTSNRCFAVWAHWLMLMTPSARPSTRSSHRPTRLPTRLSPTASSGSRACCSLSCGLTRVASQATRKGSGISAVILP